LAESWSTLVWYRAISASRFRSPLVIGLLKPFNQGQPSSRVRPEDNYLRGAVVGVAGEGYCVASSARHFYGTILSADTRSNDGWKNSL